MQTAVINLYHESGEPETKLNTVWWMYDYTILRLMQGDRWVLILG